MEVHVPPSPALRGKRRIRILRMLNAKTERTQMPSKKLRITMYLAPEEYSQIAESAERAGISLSTFARRVCLGMEVPSMEHRQAVRDILKANVDLGRLGGLLKLALSEGGDPFTLKRMLADIDNGQRGLKTAAGKLR